MGSRSKRVRRIAWNAALVTALVAGLSCGLFGLLSAYCAEVGFSVKFRDKAFPPREGEIYSTDWSMEFDDGALVLRRWDRKHNSVWGTEDLLPPADIFTRPLAYYHLENSTRRIAELRCHSLFPFLVLTVPSAAVFARRVWRARVLRRPDHCRTCGYNLTGNVSGRCPEYGAAVTGGEAGRVGSGA